MESGEATAQCPPQLRETGIVLAALGHSAADGDERQIDNLLHSDHANLRVRFSVVNLTNKEALYNFLPTFSGTHFVTPRAFQVQAGVTF